jgi:hypothetical protein
MIHRYTPNRLLSLTEMRRSISTAYRFKRHSQVQNPFLSPWMRELVTETDLHLEKNILDRLERSMNQSPTMRVQKGGRTFVVLSGRSRYEILSDNYQCRYPIISAFNLRAHKVLKALPCLSRSSAMARQRACYTISDVDIPGS